MLDRLLTLLVSMALAVSVWFYARNRDVETVDNVPVPVQLKLSERDADQYDVEVTGPGQILASFTGPAHKVRELRGMMNRGELAVQLPVSVPAAWRSEQRVLDSIRVAAADLHPPPGVKAVVAEGQNRIPVTIRRIVERRLPVKLDHALHDRLMHSVCEPSTVLVKGPQEILDRIGSIPTRPYTLPSSAPASNLHEVEVRSTVPLVTELEGRPIQPAACFVDAKIKLRPERRTYELTVPVHFLVPANAPVRAQWLRNDGRSGKVTVKLLGPPLAENPAIVAYIDLTRAAYQHERDPSQVIFSEEPLRFQLPPEFTLAQEPPKAETFLLVAVAPEPGKLPFLGGIVNP